MRLGYPEMWKSRLMRVEKCGVEILILVLGTTVRILKRCTFRENTMVPVLVLQFSAGQATSRSVSFYILMWRIACWDIRYYFLLLLSWKSIWAFVAIVGNLISHRRWVACAAFCT